MASLTAMSSRFMPSMRTSLSATSAGWSSRAGRRKTVNRPLDELGTDRGDIAQLRRLLHGVPPRNKRFGDLGGPARAARCAMLMESGFLALFRPSTKHPTSVRLRQGAVPGSVDGHLIETTSGLRLRWAGRDGPSSANWGEGFRHGADRAGVPS
jgi:hypothetical protein